MTCTTTSPSWNKLPIELYSVFYSLLDPISARALSGVEKRANEAFLRALPQLIGCHFRCKSNIDLPLNDQHWAHTISSSPNALPIYMTTATIRLDKPGTQLFKASQDFTKALSAEDELLFFWDLTKGKLAHTFVGHTDKIRAFDMNPEATWAVTKSDREIKIWDLQEKICLKTLAEDKSGFVMIIPSANPDEKKFAKVGPFAMEIVDANTEESLFNCPFKLPNSCDCLISPDGKKMFYTQVTENFVIQSLVDPKDSQVVKAKNLSSCWVVNPDGTRAYTADFKWIKIWDLKTGEMLKCIKRDERRGRVTGLLISDDEQTIVSSNNFCLIEIWHAPTGKLINSFASDSQRPPRFLNFSEDGMQLMFVDDELTIRFINLAPLPHAYVGVIAQSCLEDPVGGFYAFKQLPSFVTKSIGDRRGYLSQDLLAFRADKAYQQVCDYSNRHFLPGIAQLFEATSSPRLKKEKEALVKSAFHRFQLLPEGTQNLVYKRLFSIHATNGKCRSWVDPNSYGKSAFYNEDGVTATNDERILALKGGIPRYEPPAPKALPPVRKRRR